MLAIENSINYALRVIKPVLDGKVSAVEVKHDAEARHAEELQADLRKTVFGAGGCKSWYVNEDSGKSWNAMTYPYSQPTFWYRCLFPVWRDWNFIVSAHPPPSFRCFSFAPFLFFFFKIYHC